MFEIFKGIGKLIFHSVIFLILLAILIFGIIGAVKCIF